MLVLYETEPQVVYNKKMFPAVFLDRDGVLIENREDYVREWSQVFIYPKTYLSLFRIQQAGYKIIIVTNQSAVGRGLISLQTAEEINRKLVETLRENSGQVDQVYMCPHHPDDGCDCRKPEPGMILQAARELDLDLPRSWMIGDAWSDMLAGQTAGVQGLVMVKTGRGRDQLGGPQPDVGKNVQVADDISDAVQTILQNRSAVR
jgi:D-glycero-D-manno-heptose 1,7-bisphosphate phosphatase